MPLKLSVREKEVVLLICEGFTSGQIADRLFISKITVNNHRAHILKKIRSDNVVAIVIYAIRTGIYKI
jgi:DNA-binding CsgD family transcriptional regulator